MDSQLLFFIVTRARYFLEHLNICANLLIIDLSELQLIHNPHSWKRLSILGAILGMCLMVHRHSCCILYSTLRTLVFFHHNNNVMATHTHLITIMSLSKKKSFTAWDQILRTTSSKMSLLQNFCTTNIDKSKKIWYKTHEYIPKNDINQYMYCSMLYMHDNYYNKNSSQKFQIWHKFMYVFSV